MGDVFKYALRGVLDAPTYRLFADMAVRASGEQILLGKSNVGFGADY